MTRREMEIALMRAHEERMAQHPKDLFPKPPGMPPGRRILCRGCGEEFEQPPTGGKARVWCSTACRDTVWNASRRAARKPPRLPTGP